MLKTTKLALLTGMLLANAIVVSTGYAAASEPNVFKKINGISKNNENWKTALATGEQAQIVLMSVSPTTNPKNEIGMETHHFDQVILIADGNAKVILGGRVFNAQTNDLIFIPKGTAHDVINLNANKPLKIISVYSATDIPPNSTYPKKSDES